MDRTFEINRYFVCHFLLVDFNIINFLLVKYYCTSNFEKIKKKPPQKNNKSKYYVKYIIFIYIVRSTYKFSIIVVLKRYTENNLKSRITRKSKI